MQAVASENVAPKVSSMIAYAWLIITMRTPKLGYIVAHN